MKLKEWRIKQKWGQVRLAEELGTTQESVSYWESENTMPCRENLQAITKLTKGKVTANDFI